MLYDRNMQKNEKQPAENAELKTNWDFSPLFAGDDDPFIAECERGAILATKKFVEKWKERNDFLEQPKILKEALDEYGEWLSNHGANNRVFYYFHLRTELEQNNPELRARFNKTREVSIRLNNDIQFFTLRLAKIPSAKQQEFLQSPLLATYRQMLAKIFTEAKYLLGDEEEKIMNLQSETGYHNWVRLIESLIAKTSKDNHNFPELLATLSSTARADRDWAFRAVNKILAAQADVAEAEFNSVLGYKKINDELRGTGRPDELRLVSDNFDLQSADALLAAVTGNNPLAHRYYRLKAKALGRRSIKYYERTVPVGVNKQKYLFTEAVDLLRKVLSRLDSELLEIFETFLKNGQLDVFPKQGRADGAFCAHMRKADPTYILLNHTDQLRDVLTLAHEVGHGLNNELIKKAQPEIYFDTPVSTAEVASTFIEDFVLEEIGRNAEDDQQKFALLMAKLDDDMSSIFRQIAAYRFEQEIHAAYRQEGYLAKEKIGKIFLSHMRSYLGPTVTFPAGTENWWIYWSHFRNYFYVYSYASGLLISKALQSITRHEPKKIAAVKEFLSAGTSATPAEIFAKLGLDINRPKIWQEGLKEIENSVAEAETLFEALKKTQK